MARVHLRLTNYHKVHWKEKELSALMAAWPQRETQAMGPRHLLLRLSAGSVDFIQLSKIRGAANGKLETSRGRKKPAQE
jgi:hypothetical protein